MDLCFIEDGYSRETTIPAVPGLHPALSVRFRPALAEVRFEYLRANDLNAKEQVARVAKVLKAHLESWDAKKRDGGTADITEALLARLHPALLQRLLDLVLGYSPADQATDAKN